MVKVAVLGAGINGVTCALKIKERFRHFDVTIISRDFSPNTTGDGSGGFWYPTYCGNATSQQISKWSIETYDFIYKLWREKNLDISMPTAYILYRKAPEEPRPKWADEVFGYRDLDQRDFDHLKTIYSAEYTVGHSFTSFVVRPSKVISHLYDRFISLGGQAVQGTLTSLSDHILKEYDVLVNCTGLGARTIVPDDRVFPIRGQIMTVKAPWITSVVIDYDNCNYIIPNSDMCVIGGTHQDHDFNTKVDERDTEHILNGCTRMIPSLKHAEILGEWVGLRPGRDTVRIEAESRQGKLYIHNYGHGGSGLTLFWGCGNEVLNILEQHFKAKSKY